MKKIWILTLALIVFGSLNAQEQDLTTFILIRHAEKANDGTSDPPLKDIGKERAEKLKQLFEHAEITAIYATPFKRTKSTVAPLATALGQEIKSYDPRNKDFIDKLVNTNKGGTVVISGHSNTTPMVVNKLLGKEKFKPLQEDEYDKIFIVTINKKGKGTSTLLSY